MEASKIFLFIFLTSLSPSFASTMELDPTVRKVFFEQNDKLENENAIISLAYYCGQRGL
jgi:hypothetical protein